MQSLQVLKHVNDFAAKKITISPLNLGHTTEVTCFPLNNMVIMERADVAKLAGKALSRRSHLSWDNFDQFKFDVQNVCFVEKYVDPSLQVKIACSCPRRVKGFKTLFAPSRNGVCPRAQASPRFEAYQQVREEKRSACY